MKQNTQKHNYEKLKSIK